MSRVPTFALCLCLAVISPACNASDKDALQTLPDMVKANVLEAQKYPECVRVVNAYVRRTRSWTPADYLVSVSPPLAGGRGFAVLHQDDLADSLGRNERKSFSVELDTTCSKVIEEFQFQ
ncbi:hypothetical protein [Stenotrophomonas sp.]|uniref:hypothetical protein n=1 Tax=Stenotrophomonas sp. TaxID=69392 RepID=UPI0028A63311|nr:hypothetical protein [Stenotrophomonas sp.]